MIATVLLDMDEVLVDFTGMALWACGADRERFQRTRPRGEWDVTVHLGITHDEFWQRIREYGERFWTWMPPLPWAAALVEALERRELEWYVVSSPPRDPCAASGKVRWLKRYFDPTWDRYVLTSHKHLLASPRTLLIDDSEKNLKRFAAAGGRTLLFPSLGNRLHVLADDPVRSVEESLDALGIRQRERCVSGAGASVQG